MALKGPLRLSIQNLTSEMNIDEFLELYFAESDNLPLDDQQHRKLFASHLHMHMKADFKEIFRDHPTYKFWQGVYLFHQMYLPENAVEYWDTIWSSTEGNQEPDEKAVPYFARLKTIARRRSCFKPTSTPKDELWAKFKAGLTD
jgi:hypothetical protein